MKEQVQKNRIVMGIGSGIFKLPWLMFMLLLIVSGQVMAQQVAITGTVTSETGEFLPGVNVIKKGTSIGTTTDTNGRYSLALDNGDGVLVFTFIGYAPQEISVSNRSVIDVKLLPDVTSLEEVIVVGYGTQQKKDITGSITSISSKDFSAQPITRLDQALQGRVAGVAVTNNTGAPGADVKIRIRGSNSILGDNNPLYVIDGFIGADFKNLNPDDIESIQVLKDASAAAIYGSRGANGVVIVTTKKGSGVTQVNYSTRLSSSRVIKRHNLLNAADFARVVNERAVELGGAPTFSNEKIQEFEQTGGTDWQDLIFRKAPAVEHQLSISGSTEKTSYLISGNYLDQDGVVIGSGFKRYSVRSNIDAHVSEKLSARLNFSAVRRENQNTNDHGVVRQAMAWAPTTPAYDANGDITIVDPTGSITASPLARALDLNDIGETTNGNLVGGLRYEILPGLSFDAGFGVNYTNAQSKYYQGPALGSTPMASRGSTEILSLQNINNLTYSRTFGSHNVTATAVVEHQKVKGTGFNATANDLTYPWQKYDNISSISAGGSINAGASYFEESLASILGRVNYGYKDKYLLTASVRRDGSSKFQKNNRYSVFPSVGLGWVASKEAFMQSLKMFSNVKLRASWGVTGSQAVGPYSTLSTYVTSDAGAAPSGTAWVSGIRLGNPGNTSLKWETTQQADIGLDVDFANGKVGFAVDYFNKRTTDLLLPKLLPGYVGGGTLPLNLGEVNNKGFEFSVYATPVSIQDFSWTTSFNFTNIKSEVIELDGTERVFTKDLVGNSGGGLSTASEFVLQVGEPLGALWGLNYLGTWKPSEVAEAAAFGATPGDSKYEDLNDDNVIDNEDYQIIGHGLPTTTLGWNNTFTYKNFSLNIFLQGVYGFDKLNYSYAATITANSDVRQATQADIRDRYIPGENETSNIPKFSTLAQATQSSRFVEKGDFLRLKNVTLNYTLPRTVLKKLDLSIYISGTNLMTFTKYKGLDPEATNIGSGVDINQSIDYGAYPNAKTYTLGLNVRF